ncbi:MAG: hypothetical protein HUU55_20645, partial [Myxococcales bacterium]|nr:hypothetical protein [Myxococcales bacterium]
MLLHNCSQIFSNWFPMSLTASLLIVLSSGPTYAQNLCGSPHGDLTGNGAVDVADIQCEILGNLWSLDTDAAPQPSCLVVTVPGFDIDCTGDINVTDTVLLIQIGLKAPLDTAIDSDNDMCPNVCEQPPCKPSACDDGDPCTIEGCDALGMCTWTPE